MDEGRVWQSSLFLPLKITAQRVQGARDALSDDRLRALELASDLLVVPFFEDAQADRFALVGRQPLSEVPHHLCLALCVGQLLDRLVGEDERFDG